MSLSSFFNNITGQTQANELAAAQAQQAQIEQQFLANQAAASSPATITADVKAYGTIALYIVGIIILIVIVKKVFFK